MVKFAPLILLLAILCIACPFGGKKKPNTNPNLPRPPAPAPTINPPPSPIVEPSPTASPVASPVASPSQAPIVQATPYPTPNVNPDSYLPTQPVGRTVTVTNQETASLSEALQKAQDDPTIAKVLLEGGGSITTPVILKKHTLFDSSTYSCDITDATGIIRDVSVTDYGCFLISNGVLVEGTWRPPRALADYWAKGSGRDPNDPYLKAVQALTAEQLAGTGTTILEPTYTNGGQPSIEVFQALGDACCSHTEKSENIAVVGIRIKGRQRTYDGGIRASILLGNCQNCTVQNSFLEDTGSIGLQAGGSAMETGYFAKNVLLWRNVFSGVAAANMAFVNAEESYAIENYVRRPGHHDPKFGGGVCGVDLETNTEADRAEVGVFNNLFDYEGAHNDSAGSAICLQDPYTQQRGTAIAANNVVIGGRDDRVHRYMSNGIFLVGLKDCKVINNYVFRTGQNAIQAYNLDGCVFQDQDFESTGSGGETSINLNNVVNSIVRRNNFRQRVGLEISTHPGIGERCGKGNVYEENRANGSLVQHVSVPCPQ